NHLDLAIAVALLVAYGQLPGELLDGRLLVGELGLDGAVRPVRGALAIADLAARSGRRELLLPVADAGEAAAIAGVAVFGGGDQARPGGPRGAGQTMLARARAGIRPPLSQADAIAVTKSHSRGAERPPSGLVRERPFRAPRAGVSGAGLIGGGPLPRPGEVSL